MASSDRIRLVKEEDRLKRAPAGPRSPARTPPPGTPAVSGGAPAAQPTPGNRAPAALRGVGGGARGKGSLGQPGVIVVVLPPLPVLPGVHGKVQRQQLVLRIRQGDHGWNRRERRGARWPTGGLRGSRPQQPPGRPEKGVPRPGVSLIKETEWRRTQTICASRSVKSTGVKTTTESLKYFIFIVGVEEKLDTSPGLC